MPTTPEIQLQAIASQVVKLETLQEVNTKALTEMAGGLNRLVDRLEQSDDTAKDAVQRARSAHRRIDELRQELDKMRASQRYIVTTSCTLIGLGVAAIGLALRLLQ
ncbi:hypothetical protein SAMN05444162_0096 [Paenibacillaceae bacterium GAS479]|nr:hypothetical protein SAMN05444162_0096 [Paenibacillaceae bacterium GAS479]